MTSYNAWSFHAVSNSFLPKEVLKRWAEEPNPAGEAQKSFLGEQKGFLLCQKPLAKKKTDESGGKGLERSLRAGKCAGEALGTLIEGKKRGGKALASFFGGFGSGRKALARFFGGFA